MSKFQVVSNDIPTKMTIHLSEIERCMFARLLSKFGISVDVAGDTFYHLYKRGLEEVYKQHIGEEE